MSKTLNQNRLVDVYVHNRLDEVTISRRNTQQEINNRTKSLAMERLKKNNKMQHNPKQPL
jgi:hypothetical protein